MWYVRNLLVGASGNSFTSFGKAPKLLQNLVDTPSGKVKLSVVLKSSNATQQSQC